MNKSRKPSEGQPQLSTRQSQASSAFSSGGWVGLFYSQLPWWEELFSPQYILQLEQEVVPSSWVHHTAFDCSPGGLTFFGGLVVDFSQSYVKTVGLVYRENESWHDPACLSAPMLVLLWGCFPCPVLPCFPHCQTGTACLWFLSRKPGRFFTAVSICWNILWHL